MTTIPQLITKYHIEKQANIKALQQKLPEKRKFTTDYQKKCFGRSSNQDIEWKQQGTYHYIE